MGGFSVLVLLLATLSAFSWTHLVRIESGVRAAEQAADADAAVGQIGNQLDRLNSSARRFLRSRDLADIAAARGAAQETSKALDTAIARFGDVGILRQREQVIRDGLARHAKALEIAAAATERQSRTIDDFLAASVAVGNIAQVLGETAFDARNMKAAQAATKFESSFHLSKAALARYVMTLQPSDRDSAQQELELFDAALAAQKRSGIEKFDRFLGVIGSKAPLYRSSANDVLKGMTAKAEAEAELGLATHNLDEVIGGLKQDFASLRADATAGQVATILALKQVSLLTASTAIILAVILAWLIGGSITRPIRRMTDAMQQIAEGELDVVVPALGHRDEVGRMAKALEVFREYAHRVSEAKEEAERATEAVRQTNEEQTAIFESATSGIAFIKNRIIMNGNRTLDQLFGYDPGEQVGLTTRRWYVDDEAFAVGSTPYSALASGEIHQREQQLLRKDGTAFWCRLSGSAIDAEDLSRGTVWMITDVTQEHETVEAIQQAKDVAEVANLAKSRFLATMSHEIRTPMNGILGMAQLLLSAKLEDSARQDYARTILNSGQTLLTLLNDILDLSKVEAGKIELESMAFDPAQIIQETKALFAETAANKGLNIQYVEFQPAHQRYQGDPSRLRQMLSNLTNNAIKFTKVGQISIAAQEVKREGQSAILEFSVTDTGIGVPEDKRQLLFRPFSQTDSSTTRQYGGSGLGLSIVSNLAKLMGGEVGVESESGRGSRFWFHIHAGLLETGQDSRHGTRPPQSSSPSEFSQLSGRVLVAEADPTNRKVAKSLLNKIGLTVVFAEDGKQVLDAIIQGDPADLILMDVHMPIMDGHIATEKIRQWETATGQARRPIVALTADAFESDRQKCLTVGMDDFLAKPIALGTLREVLGKWLPTESTEPQTETEPAVDQMPLDIQRVVEILKELEPLLAHNQFDAIRRYKVLQEVAAGTEVAKEIEEISHLLAECRFDVTLDRLRQLSTAHGWGKAA